MSKRFDGVSAVLIICPCTLAENWQREALALGYRDFDDKSATSDCLCMKISSWAKVVDPSVFLSQHREINNLLVIFDEAHAMQTIKSQRTQAALRLALHASCRGVVLSTGTPIKNGRPCNLLPLLLGKKKIPCF